MANATTQITLDIQDFSAEQVANQVYQAYQQKMGVAQKKLDETSAQHPLIYNIQTEIGVKDFQMTQKATETAIQKLVQQIGLKIQEVGKSGLTYEFGDAIFDPLLNKIKSGAEITQKDITKILNDSFEFNGVKFDSMSEYILHQFTDEVDVEKAFDYIKTLREQFTLLNDLVSEYQNTFRKLPTDYSGLFEIGKFFTEDIETSDNPYLKMFDFDENENIIKADVSKTMQTIINSLQGDVRYASEQVLGEVRQQIIDFFNNPDNEFTLHFSTNTDELDDIHKQIQQALGTIELSIPRENENGERKATAEAPNKIDVSAVKEAIQEQFDKTSVEIKKVEPVSNFGAKNVKDLKDGIERALKETGIEIDTITYKKLLKDDSLKTRVQKEEQLEQEYAERTAKAAKFSSTIKYNEEELAKATVENQERARESIQKTIEQFREYIHTTGDMREQVQALNALHEAMSFAVEEEWVHQLNGVLNTIVQQQPRITAAIKALEQAKQLATGAIMQTDERKKAEKIVTPTGKREKINEVNKEEAEKASQALEEKKAKVKVKTVVGDEELNVTALRNKINDKLEEAPINLKTFDLAYNADLNPVRRGINQYFAENAITISKVTTALDDGTIENQTKELNKLKTTLEWLNEREANPQQYINYSDSVKMFEWLNKTNPEKLKSVFDASEPKQLAEELDRLTEKYSSFMSEKNGFYGQYVDLDVDKNALSNFIKQQEQTITDSLNGTINVEDLRSVIQEALSQKSIVINNIAIGENPTIQSIESLRTAIENTLATQGIGVTQFTVNEGVQVANVENLRNSISAALNTQGVQISNVIGGKTVDCSGLLTAINTELTKPEYTAVVTNVTGSDKLNIKELSDKINEELKNSIHTVTGNLTVDDLFTASKNHKSSPNTEAVLTDIRHLDNRLNSINDNFGMFKKYVNDFPTVEWRKVLDESGISEWIGAIQSLQNPVFKAIPDEELQRTKEQIENVIEMLNQYLEIVGQINNTEIKPKSSHLNSTFQTIVANAKKTQDSVDKLINRLDTLNNATLDKLFTRFSMLRKVVDLTSEENIIKAPKFEEFDMGSAMVATEFYKQLALLMVAIKKYQEKAEKTSQDGSLFDLPKINVDGLKDAVSQIELVTKAAQDLANSVANLQTAVEGVKDIGKLKEVVEIINQTTKAGKRKPRAKKATTTTKATTTDTTTPTQTTTPTATPTATDTVTEQVVKETEKQVEDAEKIANLQEKLANIQERIEIHKKEITSFNQQMIRVRQRNSSQSKYVLHNLANDLTNAQKSLAEAKAEYEETEKELAKATGGVTDSLKEEEKNLKEAEKVTEEIKSVTENINNLTEQINQANNAADASANTEAETKAAEKASKKKKETAKKVFDAQKEAEKVIRSAIKSGITGDSLTSQAERYLSGGYLSKDSTNEIANALNEYRDIATQLGEVTEVTKEQANEFVVARKKLEGALLAGDAEIKTGKNIATLNNLQASIERLLTKNTKLNSMGSRGLKQQFQDLSLEIAQLSQTMPNDQDIAKVKAKFEQLKTTMETVGASGRSVLDRLSRTIGATVRRVIAGDTTYRILGQIRQIPNMIKEIDSAMTDLKRVTAETADVYDKFLTNATTKAVKLGTTVNNVISSTSQFARLGYNLEESATLAENAILYSNVGWLDVTTATNDLVSAMKAFNITAEESINVVDTFNILGNKFALTSADVGTGLRVSASALATANNSFEESAAMLTAITEITQDASSAGNALKTLSLRIRSTKAELTEMGEDAEGAAITTAKLRKQIKGITGVDILKNNNEYKSTYEIMQGIAKVWKDLTDTEKASVLESLAGKVRANQVAALLNNWSQAEKALEESMNASGTAIKENDMYLRSAEGRLNQLKATFQDFALDVFNSDELKASLKALTGIVEVFAKLDKMAVPTVFSALSSVSLLKNIKTPDYAKNNGLWTPFVNALTTKIPSKQNQLYDFTPIINGMNKLKGSTTDLDAALLQLIDKQGIYTASQKQLIAQRYKAIAAGKQATLTERELANATDILTAETVKANLAQTALSAAVSFGLGLAIQGVITILTNLAQKNEKLAEAAMQSADALKEETESIDDYKKKLEELTDSLKSGNLTTAEAYEARKDIISIQDELAQKYGIEKTAVDELNSSYEAYVENIEKVKANKADEWLSMNGKAITKANEALYKNGIFSNLGKNLKGLFGISFKSQSLYSLLNGGDIDGYKEKELTDILLKYVESSGLKITGGQSGPVLTTGTHSLQESIDKYKKFLDETKDIYEFKKEPWLKELRDEIAANYQALIDSEEYKNAVAVLKQEAEATVETHEDLRDARNAVAQAVVDYQTAAVDQDYKEMAKARTSIEQIYAEHADDMANEYIKAIFDGIAGVVLDDIESKKAIFLTTFPKYASQFSTLKGYNDNQLKNEYLLWENSLTKFPNGVVEDITDYGSVAFTPIQVGAAMAGVSIETFIDWLVAAGIVTEDVSQKIVEAKPFATIAKEIEDAQKELKAFDDAISKMNVSNESSFLTADEVNTLVGYDATLVNSVEKTASGYRISAEALSKARAKYFKEQREEIQTAIEENQAKLDTATEMLDAVKGISPDKRTIDQQKTYEAQSKSVKNLTSTIAGLKLALLELESPSVNFRSGLSDITSKAQSANEAVEKMRTEQKKYGEVTAETAINFVANNERWEDFIKLTSEGKFELLDLNGTYEDAIKQSSGYNDMVAQLQLKGSQLKEEQDKLVSSMMAGGEQSSKSVQDLQSLADELSLTQRQMELLDEITQKWFKHLENQTAITQFNNSVNDLNHAFNMGQKTAKQRAAEYEDLMSTLDKNSDEYKQAEETLYGYRKEIATSDYDKALQEIDRMYDNGLISLEEKLSKRAGVIQKYYAPGTLLGDTEDGIERYKALLNEQSQMQDEVYQKDYDTRYRLIEKQREDNAITVDEYAQELDKLNEEFFNPETGKLGQTRGAIDNKTYEENQRKIQSMQKDSFDWYRKESERSKNMGLKTVKEYWEDVKKYADKYLKDIPQFADEYRDLMDEINSTGQKEIHDKELQYLENRKSMGVVKEKEYWQERFRLAEKYYKNNPAMKEEWKAERIAYATEGLKAMYAEDLKLSQQALDRGEISLSQHLDNMIKS